MKGDVLPDHMPLNYYELLVTGLPPLYPVTVSGIEEVMDRISLPDRTAASGGEPGSVEFDVEIMAHHTTEVASMEAWYKEGQHPVSPSYKKVGTLVFKSNSGAQLRSYELTGLFTLGRELPGLDKANEGDAASITWRMSADACEQVT